MPVIYEPKGKAAEYAPLAINPWNGCLNKCRYCYVPMMVRKSREEFHSECFMKNNFLEKLEKDAQKMKGERRQVLISFTSDPCQSRQTLRELDLVLSILFENEFDKVTILTKNPKILRNNELEILSYFNKIVNQWSIGVSLSSIGKMFTEFYEPGADTPDERIGFLRFCDKVKISTWVSMEPVISPYQALTIIEALKDYVFDWKIGKINYWKEIEDEVDWKLFATHAKEIFDKLPNTKYYFKDSLKKYLED